MKRKSIVPKFFIPCVIYLLSACCAFTDLYGADAPSESFVIHPYNKAPFAYLPRSTNQGRASEGNAADEHITKVVRWLKEQTAVAQQRGNVQGRNEEQGPANKISPRQKAGLIKLQERAGSNIQVQWRPENGTPFLIKGRMLEKKFSGVAKASADLEELTARAFLWENKELLKLESPDNEFILRKHERDELGFHHLRFEQTYQMLPVWPCELIVHINAQGNVYLMNGTYIATPAGVEIQPRLSSDEAVKRARLKLEQKAGDATKPELIIHGTLEKPPRLAWKFDLQEGLDKAWRCVVDAVNGSILSSHTLVQHQAISGNGMDGRGNSRSLHLWQDGTSYYMVDTSKSMFDSTSKPPHDGRGVILIYDGANKEVTDPQFSAGLVSSLAVGSGWDEDAVGAAFGLSQTFDYYRERFGRNSLDGNGGNIRAIVRYGNKVQNAFWFPSTKTMVFGFGFTREIDISGHELTHGVMDSIGNGGILEYRNQPGALNEALADIFGEMVEARFKGVLPDWLKADPFNPEDRSKLLQDYSNPGAVQQLQDTPNPSKMSEFVRLSESTDNGGVHINSSIINHCFYLLVKGMDGALGIADSERIFYRAMTTHLQKQSQFIDMRHACVTAAEEIFGADSTQVKKTSEAFDAVEIIDAPSTPAPSPIPSVNAPDSTLALRFDDFAGEYYLVRREAARNDPQHGELLDTLMYLAPRRVSVSGNGQFLVFVTEDLDVGSILTDGTSPSLGEIPGVVYSVAAAPDGNRYALVVIDQQTGMPADEIWIVELNPEKVRQIKLFAPGTEGAKLDIVKHADSMYFMSDSQTLVYDAYSELRVKNGGVLGSWTLYALDLVDESIRILIDLNEGLDFGNPSLGHTKNNLLTFEVIDKKTGISSLFTTDLQTGKKAEIGKLSTSGSLGIPGYNGDDTAIIYAMDDSSTLTGASLIRQSLASDGVTPTGQPTLWMEDADFGVIYRRGQFISSNSLPIVRLTTSGPVENLVPPATIILEAVASDPDGQVAKVEFYEGSTKLVELTAPPYRITLSEVPAREYRFLARAVDNLGGAQDSTPVEVTVGSSTGTGSGSVVSLRAERSGEQLRLLWPASAAGFVLQSLESLQLPLRWVNVPNVPSTEGQTHVVVIPIGSGQKFYRLTRTP